MKTSWLPCKPDDCRGPLPALTIFVFASLRTLDLVAHPLPAPSGPRRCDGQAVASILSAAIPRPASRSSLVCRGSGESKAQLIDTVCQAALDVRHGARHQAMPSPTPSASACMTCCGRSAQIRLRCPRAGSRSLAPSSRLAPHCSPPPPHTDVGGDGDTKWASGVRLHAVGITSSIFHRPRMRASQGRQRRMLRASSARITRPEALACAPRTCCHRPSVAHRKGFAHVCSFSRTHVGKTDPCVYFIRSQRARVAQTRIGYETITKVRGIAMIWRACLRMSSAQIC